MRPSYLVPALLCLGACSARGVNDAQQGTNTASNTTTTTTSTTNGGGWGGAGPGTTTSTTTTSTTTATQTGTGGDGAGSSTGGSGAGGPVCPGQEPPDCSPGVSDCSQGYDGPSCFMPLVQGIISHMVNQSHPDWFDWTDGYPFVIDPELYMDTVVAELNAAGVCAIRDPNAGDEIVVKHDNAFAENFDILTWQGWARWGGGIYTSTCVPAWF